jgi:HKD family nuclease
MTCQRLQSLLIRHRLSKNNNIKCRLAIVNDAGRHLMSYVRGKIPESDIDAFIKSIQLAKIKASYTRRGNFSGKK